LGLGQPFGKLGQVLLAGGREREKKKPAKDRELIQLIRRMWSVNPTSGSPRIRDELAKLGLQASTETIRKYRPKSRSRPPQGWWTFHRSHAGTMTAMDFFVVPTVTIRLLYVPIVITHERRSIVYFNITQTPTAPWTAQQIVSASPYDTAPQYLLGTGIQSTDRSSYSELRAWA
jgi:hypothetical protein